MENYEGPQYQIRNDVMSQLIYEMTKPINDLCTQHKVTNLEYTTALTFMITGNLYKAYDTDGGKGADLNFIDVLNLFMRQYIPIVSMRIQENAVEISSMVQELIERYGAHSPQINVNKDKNATTTDHSTPTVKADTGDQFDEFLTQLNNMKLSTDHDS